MQNMDELTPPEGGPIGGGIDHASFTWGMDMAVALRTMPCAQLLTCVRACIGAAGAGHADHR